MKYNLKEIEEEIDKLSFNPKRVYNLTSATYELNRHNKRLVPIMLDCCLG